MPTRSLLLVWFAMGTLLSSVLIDAKNNPYSPGATSTTTTSDQSDNDQSTSVNDYYYFYSNEQALPRNEPRTPPQQGDIWQFSHFFNVPESIFVPDDIQDDPTPSTTRQWGAWKNPDVSSSSSSSGTGGRAWVPKYGGYRWNKSSKSSKSKSSKMEGYYSWYGNEKGGLWTKSSSKSKSSKMEGYYSWYGNEKGGLWTKSSPQGEYPYQGNNGKWGGKMGAGSERSGKMNSGKGMNTWWHHHNHHHPVRKHKPTHKEHMRYYGKWTKNGNGKGGKGAKSSKSSKSWSYKGKGKGARSTKAPKSTNAPKVDPSNAPSSFPTASSAPSSSPTVSAQPTVSAVPTGVPSAAPSRGPFTTTADLEEAVGLFLRLPAQAEEEYGEIEDWDVSQLTNFANVFSTAKNAEASSFNEDISSWDVSNGQDFSGMFAGASSFDQDLSPWAVSAGTDFDSMFQGASSFAQDLCVWGQRIPSTSSVTNMFADSDCDDTSDPQIVDGFSPSFCTVCTSAAPSQSSSPTTSPTTSLAPSQSPTDTPSESPTDTPSESPTDTPTATPPTADWEFQTAYDGLFADEFFGASVAITDDASFFVGGAPFYDEGITQQGRVDLVNVASDVIIDDVGTAEFDTLGFIVSMSATNELIASSLGSSGNVQLYDESMTRGQQIQTGLEGGSEVFQVSNDGNWIVVAGDEVVGQNAPALSIKVYELNQGTLSFDLYWSEIDDTLGDPGSYRVAITADGSAVVLAIVGDASIGQTGSFRVYQRDDGNAEYAPLGQEVTSSEVDDMFGEAVGIATLDNGDLIVAVGIPSLNEVAVYTFDGTAWVTYVDIEAGAGFDESEFGFSLAFNGNGSRMIVGAPCYTDPDIPGNLCDGAIEVFDISQGSATTVGTFQSGTEGSLFGYSVALSADGLTFIAGAPDDCFSADDCPGFVILFQFEEDVQ